MMDKKKIIQQGEEAKFSIAIKDFDMDANEFSVQLMHGYRRTVIDIPKETMIKGSDGKWYFTFSTAGIAGRVTALCTWQVPDTDFRAGYRVETDIQYLCFVVTTPCPRFVGCPCEEASNVTYTRTEQSGVADDYSYLQTSQGDYIITADGEAILVLKNQNE